MSQSYKILAINPGSTSTKITVYQDRDIILEKKFAYDSETLSRFAHNNDQKEFRLKDILEFLREEDFPLEELSAVVGRGGVLIPVKSGAYVVNELMLDRLANRPKGNHASNLGAMLAYDIAKQAGVTAYVYDGVTMDELTDIARITGVAEVKRYSRCHALNMRATAMKAAEKLGKAYHDVNLIVVHMGGGITMSVHEKGRMVDVILDTEGPISPERSGRLPITPLFNYIEYYQMDYEQMQAVVRGTAGMVSHLGTNSALEVEQRMQAGDEKAKLIFDAMIYQTAKGIGELSTVVCGKVDQIVITGALAYSDYVTAHLKERVSFLAPVEIFPGENEMESLAMGILRVLTGQEQAHEYDVETDSVDVDETLF